MQNRKALLKQSELATLVRHAALLAFAFLASMLFSMMGFIYSAQIPLTMLLAFLSVEWVYFQHKRSRANKIH